MFRMSKLLTALIVAVVCSVAQPAIGGHYSDPSGFSFDFPDDWVALTHQGVGEMQESLSPEIQAWLTNCQWALETIPAMGASNDTTLSDCV